MYAIDLLKSAVEGLAEPDTLSDHPLAAAKFVACYASRHPEFQSQPRGEILGRALAVLWRERCLPLALKGRLKREWNLFLTLEVGYFFPFRHEQPFPGGLPQLGGLLLDRAHVALVIADGDEARAQTLLQSDYADLWETIAPSDRKDSLALGISTVASRRDAALRRVAKELEKLEMQLETAGAPSTITPSAPIDTLGRYRQYLQASAPTWIPEEWSDTILDLACTTTRLSIVGATGGGKTELLRAAAQRLCQTEALPLYVRICDYASHAPQQDILQFAAMHGEFSRHYLLDEGLRQDFLQQLAEAYRADRLILLADQMDDLYEREWYAVIQNAAAISATHCR